MSAEYWYDLPVIRPPMAVTLAAGSAPSTHAMPVVLVLVSVVAVVVPLVPVDPDVVPVPAVEPVSVVPAVDRYSSRLLTSVLTSSCVSPGRHRSTSGGAVLMLIRP